MQRFRHNRPAAGSGRCKTGDMRAGGLADDAVVLRTLGQITPNPAIGDGAEGFGRIHADQPQTRYPLSANHSDIDVHA